MTAFSTSRTRLAALALAASLGAASPAFADGDRCQAGPETGWKPLAELVQKLAAEGWRLRSVEIDDGCYEVKGVDKDGRYHEAYFHPVSLDRKAWAF